MGPDPDLFPVSFRCGPQVFEAFCGHFAEDSVQRLAWPACFGGRFAGAWLASGPKTGEPAGSSGPLAGAAPEIWASYPSGPCAPPRRARASHGGLRGKGPRSIHDTGYLAGRPAEHPAPQATDRVPQPRCTERKGSNEALPPHVAAGPRRRRSPLAASDGAHSGGDSTPSERTQALAQSPTSERVICVPQKKSKFRASARPLLLWLRRQGTYKDSALPATKRSRLASCCFRWANTDRERSYIEPQLPTRD